MVVLACGKRHGGLGALERKIARQAAHQRMERATGERELPYLVGQVDLHVRADG
jgi:hypothetical protein